MTTLPTAPATIVRLSMMGSPLRTRMLSVRVKRLMTALRTIGPKIGTEMTKRSRRRRPRSVRKPRVARKISTTSAARNRRMFSRRRFEAVIMARVSVGSFWPMSP